MLLSRLRGCWLQHYRFNYHWMFSARIVTALELSKAPLRTWVFAICLKMTSLKGVSSIKLRRDVKETQMTAWLKLRRFRDAWAGEQRSMFSDPVEVDETYIGDKR